MKVYDVTGSTIREVLAGLTNLGRAIKGDEVGHTKISSVFMPGKQL